MERVNYPYAGFSLSWYFFTHSQENHTDLEILEGLFNVLKICEKYELLFPSIDIYENSVEYFFEQIKQQVNTKKITYDIDCIEGDGLIYFPNGEKKVQANLVTIDSFRLNEKYFEISTDKGIWSPISFDTDHNVEWQIELAELNAPRLEKCLEEIHNVSKTNVSPAPNEVNKESLIWRKGFKLYPSEGVLLDKIEEDPPNTDFKLNKYLMS